MAPPRRTDSKRVQTPLGLRIKARRLQLGISQARLARMCDWESGRVWQYEQCGLNATELALSKLAGALKCSVGYLLGSDPMPPDPRKAARKALRKQGRRRSPNSNPAVKSAGAAA